MNNAPLSHPGADQLAAFKLGRLGNADTAEVESHLVLCNACCQTLEAMPNDTLLSLLKAPSTFPSSASAPQKEKGSQPETATTLVTGPAGLDVPVALANHPRYRVLELLGMGGMGAVYKAEHRLMERPVALKVIRSGLVDRPGAVERFRREVKAAARLSHPNIVTSHDAEQAGDTHFLVMEYVEGTTLDKVVQQRGPLPVGQACEYIRQAALGLQHAFEHGMVHRDIKPQNIMLVSGEKGSEDHSPRTTHHARTIKILDFGLARFASEAARPTALTESGLMMGTPDFIAPEQAEDPRQADTRADIYSLGCTLYSLLSGSPPFAEGTPMQKVLAHRERAPKPLTDLRPDLPLELVKLVNRMMAKDPGQRYQTPAELAQVLEPFTQEPRGPAIASAPLRRRPRRLILGAAALVLAGICFLGVAVYRISTDKGTLVIETDDPDVQVSVKNNGEEVTILDAKTKQEVTLKSGTYEFVLKGGKPGLKLETSEFTLKRGDKRIVKVRREPKPVPSVGRQLLVFRGHAGTVYDVEFSPDGRRLLSAGHDGTVKLWDMESGQEIRTMKGHAGPVYDVAFSPDGRRLASAGIDGTVKVWDAESGRECLSLKRNGGPVPGIAFGRTIASGSEDGTVTLWHAGSGQEIRTLTGHSQTVHSVTFSRDQRRLASASDDKTVKLWDLELGKEIRTLKGHTGALYSVAFSPDGRRLASGGYDNTVKLWNAESGQEIRTLTGHTSAVDDVAFSPDGRWLASGSYDNTVRLWDAESGQEIRTLEGHSGHVSSVAFSPDGHRLASTSSDGTVRLWDVTELEKDKEFELNVRREPPAVNGRQIYQRKVAPEVSTVAISPDGSLALCGTSRGEVLLWNLEDNVEPRPLLGHSSWLNAVAFCPDGRRAVSGGDKSVIIWEIPSGKILHRLPHGGVRGLTVSPDGSQVLCGSLDGSLQLWNANTGALEHSFEKHKSGVEGVAISPDGRRAVSAGSADRVVWVWDLEGRRRLKEHTLLASRLVFCPDGRRVLSAGSLDNSVLLWDVETGKELRFMGHTNIVDCVAVSRDGKRALSGSYDKTVRLWEIASGECLACLEGHSSVVTGVAFSPDGRRALSGSYDGAVRLWRLPEPPILSEARPADSK